MLAKALGESLPRACRQIGRATKDGVSRLQAEPYPGCSITPAHQVHALPWTQAAGVMYPPAPKFCGQRQSQRDSRFYAREE